MAGVRWATPRVRRLLAAGVGSWALSMAVNRSLVRVEGPSMLPTLWPGDVVATLPLFGPPPGSGALVVVDVPGRDTRAVKRVVAVDGHHVAVRDGAVLVDDVPVDLPATGPAGCRDGRLGSGAWNVSRGHVFVLGDHAAASTDSRAWGPLPLQRVRRRVLCVVRPRARRPFARAGLRAQWTGP